MLPETVSSRAGNERELLTPGEVSESSVTQTQLPGYSCHSDEQLNILKLLERTLYKGFSLSDQSTV